MRYAERAPQKTVLALVSFAVILLSTATAAQVQQPPACEEANLENMLNKVDKPNEFAPMQLQRSQSPQTPAYQSYQQAPQQRFNYPGQQYAPPVTPTPQVFNRPVAGPQVPAMSYSMRALGALQNSALWRNLRQGVGYGGAGPGQPGGNPFNLTPFGMLHYMWDDTTYVSDANPVTLYQVQNDLQYAQQQSQMAQAAAARAKYAATPEERQQAAQQAQYYASQAKAAAERAREQSNEGSLNPTEVAQAVAEQADKAQQYARQARGY